MEAQGRAGALKVNGGTKLEPWMIRLPLLPMPPLFPAGWEGSQIGSQSGGSVYGMWGMALAAQEG